MSAEFQERKLRKMTRSRWNSGTTIFLAVFFGFAGCACAASAMARTSVAPHDARGAAAAPQNDAKAPAMNMGQSAAEGPVKRVEEKQKICMVTNKAFDKPQIPVVVDGKTYYGCCEMCKGVLTNDASQRMAVDPVSKKKVDKSEAVIGVAANGGVIYFENEKDLKAYNKKFAAN